MAVSRALLDYLTSQFAGGGLLGSGSGMAHDSTFEERWPQQPAQTAPPPIPEWLASGLMSAPPQQSFPQQPQQFPDWLTGGQMQIPSYAAPAAPPPEVRQPVNMPISPSGAAPAPQAMIQSPPGMPPVPGGGYGMGNPAEAGFAGFANSGGGLLPAISNLIGGLRTGQRQDPRGMALQATMQQQDAIYKSLRADGVPHEKAVAAALNPDNYTKMQELALRKQQIEQPIQLPLGSELVDRQTGLPLNPEAGSGQVVKDNVEAIKSGRQPPILSGNSKFSPLIKSGLEKTGFNLADAAIEWTRAQKQIQSLNGPQMTRFVGLADSVDRTIDEVRDLSKQMKLSGIPLLNKVELGAYIQTQGNSPNGQLATRYVTAINTLKEEFANLANGGYAPTESAWKLANDQINANYGDKQLTASLDEVQRLIRYRKQAIPNLDTLGPGGGNRYFQQSGAAAHQAPATSPATESNTGPAAPPLPAIQALRKNPRLLDQFEAKYGKGSAKRYLNEI